MRRNISARTVLNFIAYVALILVTIALVCVKIFKPGKFTSAMQIVAESLAYLVLIMTSFGYAYSKRNVLWMIGWFAFAAVLIVMVVLVN